jgi:hypothetical protein
MNRKYTVIYAKGYKPKYCPICDGGKMYLVGYFCEGDTPCHIFYECDYCNSMTGANEDDWAKHHHAELEKQA